MGFIYCIKYRYSEKPTPLHPGLGSSLPLGAPLAEQGLDMETQARGKTNIQYLYVSASTKKPASAWPKTGCACKLGQRLQR